LVDEDQAELLNAVIEDDIEKEAAEEVIREVGIEDDEDY